MKKVYSITGLIILIILVFIICEKKTESDIYKKYRVYKEFYGEDLYKEIDYESTEEEQEIGEEIVSKFEQVLQYTGTEEMADESVGELKRFYWFPFYIQPSSCKSSVSLITTKIQGDEGHVWVSYFVCRYDEDDTLINGTGDGITLLYIEKKMIYGK